MSIPTWPKTRRFAAATYAFPGPTILSTGAIVAVPKASAATACAPPTRVHLVDPDQLGGGENERVEDAAGSRHGHHQPPDASDFGGDRVHQHRGRVGGGTAGDIKPGGRNRAPTIGEPNPERIHIIDCRRQLKAMKAFDPSGGEPQRGDRFGRGRSSPLGNLAARNAQAGNRKVNAVEAVCVIDQRGITAARDILDDRRDHRIDIRLALPLGLKQSPESRFEPGFARCEPNRHQPSLSLRPVGEFEFHDAAALSRGESARSNRRPLPGGSSAPVG